MQQRSITFNRSSIHYYVYGTGPQLVFCFHGYGEDGSIFEAWENDLGENFTLAAPDMPFHGRTEWNEGLLFSPDQLLTILQGIQQAIGFSSSEKYSLAGYSMGGRVCLHLLQMVPAQVNRAVLLAADGLHKNPWYFFATQNWLGKKVFRQVMNEPKFFFGLLTAGRYAGLVKPASIKIVQYYLNSPEERRKLYARWTAMRQFKPGLKKVREAIQQHNIAVRFLFGKYDSIITGKQSKRLTGNGHNVTIKVLNAGHRLLQPKHLHEVTRLFYE